LFSPEKVRGGGANIATKLEEGGLGVGRRTPPGACAKKKRGKEKKGEQREMHIQELWFLGGKGGRESPGKRTKERKKGGALFS